MHKNLHGNLELFTFVLSFTQKVKNDMNAQQIQELKKEISETLFFFVSMDMKLYGKISQETVSAFNTQRVKFPEILVQFV